MAHTRRQFLERLGHSAGAAMTYEAMAAMGLMAVPARTAGASPLQGRVGPAPRSSSWAPGSLACRRRTSS